MDVEITNEYVRRKSIDEYARRKSIADDIVLRNLNDKNIQLTNDEDETRKGVRGDILNISLLVFLYVFEGIPIGIHITIPMILASNKVPYNMQALFSIAAYPYAMKLLWAPIIDSIYSEKFGRRKSWLIPIQYVIGFFFFVISSFITNLIGNESQSPKIFILSLSFFFLLFTTATQDVCVDAWALTLLSKRNLHYAPSAETVGFIIGIFISNTMFLSFESAEFCNRWFRTTPKPYGLINLEQFLLGPGVLFIVVTTLLWIFKHETDTEEKPEGIMKTYKQLWAIIKLPSIRLILIILLTQNIGHAAVDSTAELKLIEYGVKRENLALLKVPISLFNLVLPFIITNLSKHKPLNVYFLGNFLRLFSGGMIVLIVFWTQTRLYALNGNFPTYFYIILFSAYLIHDVIVLMMRMTMWSFFAKISDASIGATYMTLLVTLSNIGWKWTATVSLSLVDLLTFQLNTIKTLNSTNLINNVNLNASKQFNLTNLTTTEANETIEVNNVPFKFDRLDGFYLLEIICFTLGLIWLKIFRNSLKKLQSLNESKWRANDQVGERNETKTDSLLTIKE